MATNAAAARRPAKRPTAARKSNVVALRAGPRPLGKPYALLFLGTLTMVSLGLVMILSASSVEAYTRYGSSFHFFRRQLAGAGVGLLAMILLARTDYRVLRRFARPLFVLCLGFLVLVLVPGIGVNAGGSSRWLDFGPVTFQPSELAKLTLILFGAHVLDKKGRNIKDAKQMAVPVLPAAGLVALLVVLQPDLGTTIICTSCTLIAVFLAGARPRHMGIIALCTIFGALLLAVSKGYRRARLFSFLDPWSDPLNAGYHVIQGQIAIGSGGWFGVGLGASRQKWSYVPNAHTDFIYAIVGEELGLVGTFSVLLLFAFLIYLGVRIARNAPDRFGLILAGGITGWIGLQALINMGAVSGLLPITGVPLPLISFGGSSLVFSMAAIGVLLSIARRGKA